MAKKPGRRLNIDEVEYNGSPVEDAEVRLVGVDPTRISIAGDVSLGRLGSVHIDGVFRTVSQKLKRRGRRE